MRPADYRMEMQLRVGRKQLARDQARSRYRMSPSRSASVVIGCAASCAAIIGVGCGSTPTASEPQPVVPAVVGKPTAVAIRAMQRLDLVPRVSKERSESTAAGRVLSTRPAAGTTVATGSGVAIIVSSGPPPPALVDLVATAADIPLDESMTTMDSPKVVTASESRDCAFTENVKRRARGSIQVGNGSNAPVISITVENIGGASSAQRAITATRAAQEGCLKRSPIDRGPSDAFFSQIDTYFTATAEGRPVFGFGTSTLPRATGEPVFVQQDRVTWSQGPYVVDVSITQADSLPIGLGQGVSSYLASLLATTVDAQIDLMKEEMNDSAGRACCVFAEAQAPAEDDAETPAATTTSLAPGASDAAPDDPVDDGIPIPDVTGTDVESARAALQGAGFLVSVTGAQSTQPEGTVIDQDPLGGGRAASGSSVTLVVAFP